MAKEPELLAHQEWLGYVQPVGLVVSPPALLAASALINRNIIPEHRRFLEWIEEVSLGGGQEPALAINDLPGLLQKVFGWEEKDLVGGLGAEPLPATLEVTLPAYNETLRPTYAVPEPDPKEGASPWLLLVQVVETGCDLDEVAAIEAHHWQASPQARFERLLREAQVPIGLLCNGTHLRLIYAPRGESSGYLTFPVQALSEVAGRPLFAALHLLLEQDRLFTLPENQRLPALLSESRKYQNLVSTRLANQVLAALYELLRGFQAADEQSRGALLGKVLRQDPDQVYAGLLTVLLRLTFLLYAEERDLLPRDPVYLNHYSILGLFERLRADASRFPDTMDQRYGAWAQLLALFRLVHDGASHGSLRLPARQGYLFNPDRYNFLEGRPWQVGRVLGDRIQPPRVSDGVIFRVLQNLLVLDGERISYRNLGVEHIGSVYETMMGFHLEVARGRSIAIKPAKAHGAPAALNLEALLEVAPEERAKWVREHTDQKIDGKVLEALKAARTCEDGVVALERKIATEATPRMVPAGAMVLQPSDERRRSGSHYTPRSLTEPIVRTTLRPVLNALGENPTPAQILSLKVCDLAMGSGAFLVETCRQLGDELVKAWHLHNCVPRIPPDEDEVLHARRLVAQQCLYGVDKNPMAVDLAKLSLWLATLARDHAFTFLDHALRHGDSLVGLSQAQLAAFHWMPGKKMGLFEQLIRERVEQATQRRRQIQTAGEEIGQGELRLLLKEADEALDEARLLGDLVVVAFFQGDNGRAREKARVALLHHAQDWLDKGVGIEELRGMANELREQERPVVPFHWEIEFPEVFGRQRPGFNAMVGNPPFVGGKRISTVLGDLYREWLASLHRESNSNADLVAHFFRRAFSLIRDGGTFGLVATNTIAQGDTRATGLRWICTQGGTVYSARRRLKWPGLAAVIVSVVHVHKGEIQGPFDLDGRTVPQITAFLFHAGGHENPVVLRANAGKSFIGCFLRGMGFTFDDTDTKGAASSISEMRRLIEKDPHNAERIFPYIGGEEVNTSPSHVHYRYVINFGQMSEEEARQWPDLMAIVEDNVKPERQRLGNSSVDRSHKQYWWRYANDRPELMSTIRGMERVLVISRIGNAFAFTFVSAKQVLNEKIVVFPFDQYPAVTALQSRVHEAWARFFSSTLRSRFKIP